MVALFSAEYLFNFYFISKKTGVLSFFMIFVLFYLLDN